MIVLCVDSLHEYELDPAADKIACPDCGCRFARYKQETPEVPVMGEPVSRVTVKVEEGRHVVGGDTWLDNRDKYVNMLRENLPGVSEDEAKTFTDRWHGSRE